jgi:hypothetical protein
VSSRRSIARRLIPASQWNRHHHWPPIGGLRHLIFHAKTNGFEEAFIRCGRRVLVDEERFFEIIQDQQEVNRGS